MPGDSQNILEVVYDLVKSIAVTQMGPSYYPQFLPFVATIFLFVLGSNVAGALIPWKLIEIPSGELAAPTNDINTTACLAILTSIAYLTCCNRYIAISCYQIPTTVHSLTKKRFWFNNYLYNYGSSDHSMMHRLQNITRFNIHMIYFKLRLIN